MKYLTSSKYLAILCYLIDYYIIQVGLADRSLMPGDVVRRMIKGKDTQRGYCRDVKVKTAIQVCGSPYVITNVSSERLKTIEEFASDLAVCLDSWVINFSKNKAWDFLFNWEFVYINNSIFKSHIIECFSFTNRETSLHC